jgi:hypothetical protein
MGKRVEVGSVALYLGDSLSPESDWIAEERCGFALVTDPPYGIRYSGQMPHSTSPTRPIVGDGSTEARESALSRFRCDESPALVFGTWKAPRPAGVREVLIWSKGDWPGMGDMSLPWGRSHEEIYVLGEGFIGKRTGTVLFENRVRTEKGPNRHPTVKPVRLMERLIEAIPDGFTVLDPFAGSGSTLVAALRLGRKAIGIEIDPIYFETASRRIAASQPLWNDQEGDDVDTD